MNSDRLLKSRRMEPADLEQVLKIENVSFPAPWTRTMFLEEMSNRSARLVVFITGNRIAGYLCFWEVLDEAHLMNIAVHPDWRGRGYGKYIMDRLEAICLKDRLKRIILDVGRRNLPARNLYRKCGFSSVGFRKNYYTSVKDDAIVMEKWLGSKAIDKPKEEPEEYDNG
jgi:ribosomal-protein-alanine N-acetyltransferase